MRFYWLVLGTLAVWRVTHLIHAEDGPWDVVARLRRWVGRGFWGKLMDCFYCLSVWIAAPAALWIGADWVERAFLWLALSGGASLLERATTPPAAYTEDEEE